MPVVQSRTRSVSSPHAERFLCSSRLPFVAHGWEEQVHASPLPSSPSSPLPPHRRSRCVSTSCYAVPGLFNRPIPPIDELLRAAVVAFSTVVALGASTGRPEGNCKARAKGTSSHNHTQPRVPRDLPSLQQLRFWFLPSPLHTSSTL